MISLTADTLAKLQQQLIIIIIVIVFLIIRTL
jgi:hypothetical protein